MHNFQVYWISLYMFRRSFRSSSGVQECTHTIRYMSYRLADYLLAGSCPLASSQLTCMTYTWWCVYSLELLMMDGKTSETCRVIFNKLENCASSWVYYRNISRCTVLWTSSFRTCVTYCNDGSYAKKDIVCKVRSTQQGDMTCIKTLMESM